MKKIILVLLIAVLLLSAIFFIAGTPLVLNIVRDKIASTLQDRMNVPLYIGSLKGNIFYTLEASEINVDNTIHLNRLKISYNILKLLSKQIDIGSASLDGLNVDIDRVRELAQALEKPKKDQPGRIPFNVRIKKLSITNTQLVGAVNNKKIDLSLSLKGQVTHNVVTIETLSVTTDSSHIAVKGTVPLYKDGEIDIVYSADLLVNEFSPGHLEGSLLSSGSVHGMISSPKITGGIDFSIKYRDNKLIGSSEISWQSPLLDSLNLTAAITAETPPLRGNTAQKDSWEISASLQNTVLACDLSSKYGNARLTGFLKGSISNPEFFADLAAGLRYARFQPEATGRIALKDNALSIKNFIVSSKKLNLKGSAYVHLADPQKIEADFVLNCSNIDVVNNFVTAPLPVSGKLRIDAKAKGKIRNPSIKSTVEFKDIVAFSEKETNAEFTFMLKDSIINLSSGLIQSTRGQINLDGWYGIADSQFNVHISSSELRLKSPEIVGNDTIPIDGAIGIDANFKGHITNPQGDGVIVFKDFVYDTIKFDTYELTFSLKDTALDASLSNDIKTVELSATAALYEPFRFNCLLRLNHFDFKDYVRADTGYVSANLSVQGRVNKPQKIAGKVQIENLYMSRDHYRMHNLDTISVVIKDGIADIVACPLSLQGQRIDVQGHVPLDIAEGEIDLACKTARIDLAALAALVPGAPEVQGFLFLDVAAHGKIQNPDFLGQIRLEEVKYAMPDITIDSVYSLLMFQKNLITIKYFRGRINKGHLGINGFARMGATVIDTMFLDISLDKIAVKSKDFGLVDIDSKIQATAKKDSVKIGGEVTINKAVYNVPFNLQTIVELLTKANRPPQEQSEIAKRIYCDVGISAPHGVQIANNVADVLVDVDVQIRGYLSRLNVYGTIQTPKKGTIKYLGKEFDITNAVIQFDDPYRINPVLNLESSSFISSIDGDYEISLSVTGTVEKWHLELSSNPPVPEQDIISLLLIGRRRPGTYLLSEARSINLKGTAKDYAEGLIRGTVERTAEKTLGFEKVEITGDILDPMQLDIGIEKKISRRFTLIYGTGIESWEFRRVGLNYDITDNVSIYTLHDQENLNSSVDLDIHFKLK